TPSTSASAAPLASMRGPAGPSASAPLLRTALRPSSACCAAISPRVTPVRISALTSLAPMTRACVPSSPAHSFPPSIAIHRPSGPADSQRTHRSMALFPIFLKLTARPCTVIGAGNLAESKIESLLAANARVTVIAPKANERITDLAGFGEITLHRREYKTGDLSLNGTVQFLAVAATDNPAVNRAVFAEAEA